MAVGTALEAAPPATSAARDARQGQGRRVISSLVSRSVGSFSRSLSRHTDPRAVWVWPSPPSMMSRRQQGNVAYDDDDGTRTPLAMMSPVRASRCYGVCVELIIGIQPQRTYRAC